VRIGPILRTLPVFEALPARLRAAERLPVELDVQVLGREETLLHGDEIIEPHAFGRDPHREQLSGRTSDHGLSSGFDIGNLERVQRLASAPRPSNAASNALAIASLLFPGARRRRSR
jgi:hypothetical protein